LMWLAFCAWVVQLGGCAARPAKGRDPIIAFESAVRIVSTCTTADGSIYGAYGSGVIIDRTTLLTAAHVAEDREGVTCVRVAMMMHGKKFLVIPHRVLPDRDLASMKIVFGEFDPTYPVVYGPPPAYGARVCSMVAYPRVLWRCGEAQTRTEPPGDMLHTITTEGGNSGSGVYDMRGRLIGIITHRFWCNNGQHCGGKLALLDGYLKDLL
jgi:S1-C subfamily serine protease